MTQDRTRTFFHQAVDVDAVLNVRAHGDGERVALVVGDPAVAARRAFPLGVLHDAPFRLACSGELELAARFGRCRPVSGPPVGGDPVGCLK